MAERQAASILFNKAKGRRITAKVTPMPADTIADRIISAGWLLSQMDLAGGNRAYKYAGGRAVTVGLDSMEFKAPVYIGDEVSIYTEIVRQGTSSMAIKIEAFAEPRAGGTATKVTEGLFTFVHIDEDGKPAPLDGTKSRSAARTSKASQTEIRKSEPVLRQGQELSIRTVPFPRDKNHNGDIFGGWVLAQMDLAGALRARKFTGHRAVPVAIDAMTFHRPLTVHDEVSFYTEIKTVGRTSVTINVEAWALKEDLSKYEKVTEGSFTYVAIDRDRKPVPHGCPSL